MLLPKQLWDPIARGEVTLAFRRWRRPTVRAGGTLRSPAGRLAITALDEVDPATITDAAAVRAGAGDADEVRAALASRPDGRCYRIEFHVLDEPDPRALLAADDDLDPEALADLRSRLDRSDARSARGAWTRQVLRLVADQPEVAAGDLAASIGWPRADLKRDVRKLKALGLTTSHRVGYSLTPRGHAFLAAEAAAVPHGGET